MRRCFSLGKTLAAHLKAAGPVVGLDNCKCKVLVAAVEFVTDFADAHTQGHRVACPAGMYQGLS